MKKRVLVTGSSNITGSNVISALISANIEVCGCDYNENNPSNLLCKNYVINKCTSIDYAQDIENLITIENITHIIVTNDHEIRAMYDLKYKIEKFGVKVNGLTENVLNFLDKELTSEIFIQSNVNTPEKLYDRMDFPYVLRSKEMGNKKKFVHIVKTISDLNNLNSDYFENGMQTRFIQGEEFTVDVLSDDEGNIQVAIPRLRMLVKDGIVHHAKIVREEKLIEKIRTIYKNNTISGITCIQCIKTENSEYYFLEINPRPGSGIDLSIAAGVNIPQLWVENSKIINQPKWGMQMIRYFKGYYF